MRRMILAVTAAALVLLALLAGSARADPAIRGKFSVSFDVTFPAGTLCDFTYHGAFTDDINSTFVPATGLFTYLQTQHNTRTNVDTGYTLTEVDHIENVVNPVPGVEGTGVVMGLFWHLRDANGKLVLVKAGEVTYDPVTGDTIKFTPNSAADRTFAQIICPALGGSPA